MAMDMKIEFPPSAVQPKEAGRTVPGGSHQGSYTMTGMLDRDLVPVIPQ